MATDGSPGSLEACEIAALIAKSYGSEVTVLSVIPPVSALASPLEGEYYDRQIVRAREVVEGAASTLRRNGVTVARTDTPQGHTSAVDAIIEYAAEARSDLVVMGTRGLGGLRRALIGSTASGVASAAPCATLVVRSRRGKNGEKTTRGIGRILVATDGSENAQRALAISVDLAKHLKARLEIVHAAHISGLLWAIGNPGSAFPSEQIEADVIRRGEELVSNAGNFVEEAGLPRPKTYVLTNVDSPAHAIADFAKREGADLVVTGTRGLGGFKKMLLGSVASGVLHYAPCSVLVVK